MKPCEACLACKAKRKPVPKVTKTKSSIPGERFFVNTTGPFKGAINGTKYWVQAVNDATQIGFSHFIKQKDEIGTSFKKLSEGVKQHGHTIKYVQCNNAGENKKYIVKAAKKNRAKMELTAPYTPQQNGVVKWRIAVLKDISLTMMTGAGLTKAT